MGEPSVGGVRWTESLTGPLSFDQVDFNQAMMEGLRDGARATLTLTLQVNDVAAAVSQPRKAADVVRGHLDSLDLGGRLSVTDGTVVMFEQADAFIGHLHLRMRYHLNLLDPRGKKLFLDGFKLLENDPGFDSWADVTTLFTRIYTGWRPLPESGSERARRRWAEHVRARTQPPGDEPAAPHDPPGTLPPAPRGGAPAGQPEQPALATAVLQISPPSFAVELASFRGTDPSRRKRVRDVVRFGAGFLGAQIGTYAGTTVVDGRPSFPRDRPRRPWIGDPGASWHVVPERSQPAEGGRRLAMIREIVEVPVPQLPFALNLHHLARPDPSGRPRIGDRGPVLLAHGAGVRAEMFFGQPRRVTIVDELLFRGYDVWALNWRGSIDLPNVSYTLDQVARFDHPAAVLKVHELTGGQRVKALVHCQGSVSFMMAAVAGLLPRSHQGNSLVTHVVSSAISLYFEMTRAARRKQELMLPLVRRLGEGADPQWGIRSINPTGAGLALVSKLSERPCGNLPCQIANYIYGAGWDTLLCHDNIDDEVHKWTARELGYSPFTLIGQVAEASRNGHIMPARPSEPGAPSTYVDAAPQVAGAHFTLLGCERDTMFLSAGQRDTAAFLEANGVPSDYVSLPGYGHMDAYWGPKAAADVFPAIVDGLEWDGRDATRPSVTHPAPAYQAPETKVGRRRLRRRWIPIKLPFTAPPIVRTRADEPPAGFPPAPEEV